MLSLSEFLIIENLSAFTLGELPMIYCPHPDCSQRQHTDEEMTCPTCGTNLVINGRYRAIELLRKSSTASSAEVFVVQDLFAHTKIMKILRVGDPKILELFDREAHVLNTLNHDGIPKIEADAYFSVQTATALELRCLVMEKIAGIDLEQWLQANQCCPPNLALQWLHQLVDILEYLHQHQFFHRDIKPANIMLKPDGQLALVDFGAVRQITTTVWENSNLTTVLTPGYAPPEQLNCQAVPQSDFYALGRTFVHLLTGKHPLNSAVDIHGHLQWRSHLSCCFPRGLADLIDNLMAPLITKRPGCVVIIRQQLQRIERNQSSSFGSFMVALKGFNIAKIVNAIPLAVVAGSSIWWLAWKLANDWDWRSIEPLSPLAAQSLAKAKKQCAKFTSPVSEPMPYPQEVHRSSNNFDLDLLKVGEPFYVRVSKDRDTYIKFDLKQDVRDSLGKINSFDRTLIKNMKTGFYKRVNSHPLYPVYIANPKEAGRSPFKVQFCKLEL